LSVIALTAVFGWTLSPLAIGQDLDSNGYGTSMGGGPNVAQSSPANSEEQLRQLKQSLLSLAMQSKARVAASGWTNSRGTMREDVMVFSEIELEKLRPVVRSSRYGRETTKLAYQADTTQSMCAAQPVRPQRVGLTINLGANTTPANENLARNAADLVTDALSGAVVQGALSNVAILLSGEALGGVPDSTYHRFMTAGQAQQKDLQLRVAIAVEGDTSVLRWFTPSKVVRAPKRLTIELALVTEAEVAASWRNSFAVESSSQSKRDQMAWLALPDQSRAVLTKWLAQAVNDINGAISCHGDTAIAFAASGAQATLQGGRDIGVYAGQRLAILPTSSRMRDRGLQSSLSVMGLAEVVQVGPYSARVNFYAGPQAGDFEGMMAVPISVLSP
jgi:cell wall-associated NlpC family hydrolase